MKELSYSAYIRVVARELFDPSLYRPGKEWKPFKLEDFSAKDQRAIKREIAKMTAVRERMAQDEIAYKKREQEKLRRWLVKNGGKDTGSVTEEK